MNANLPAQSGAAHAAQQQARLYPRCLFCETDFPANALFGHVPPGARLAYDPARARLWSVCRRCHRWTLAPPEERPDAIDTLEHVVSGHASPLGATDNISLHAYEDVTILRVGRAPLVERAWWRYGRELRARDAALRHPLGRVATAALGAIAGYADRLGAWKLDDDWGPIGATGLLRRTRFGREAWSGRVRCPYCTSILRAVHFDVGWWLHPRIDDDGLVVGVPCTRCDPWTPRNVFDVRGEDAEYVLRRVLAYQHLAGADERRIREAVALIEGAGSAPRLVASVSTGRVSLWRLGPLRTLALEIALNHHAERRRHAAELLGLEAVWRAEEVIAQIVDDDLTS